MQPATLFVHRRARLGRSVQRFEQFCREAAERAFLESGERWPGREHTEETETFTVRFPKRRDTA